MSPVDLRKSRLGDEGQGDKLIQRKFASPARHSPDRAIPAGRVGGL